MTTSANHGEHALASLNLEAEIPSLAHLPGYLFHCGVAPISGRAAQALALYAQELTGQSWETYMPRQKRIAQARQQAATLIGAQSNEIAFVKSTTHGLLLVAQSIEWQEDDVIIVEEHTFPANWYVWTALEEKYGVRVVQWPERDYGYDLDELEMLLARHTVRLVSLSAVDYATGFRHDINAAGFMIKNAGALYCLDAIQAVGVVPVNVKQAQVDFLSADGHKWMLAPEGAGILYVNPEIHEELNDSMAGWLGRAGYKDYGARELPPATDATRFEEGALNMPGNLALGGSLSLLNEVGIETIWARTWANRQLIAAWGADRHYRQISPVEEPHASGIIAFQVPEKINLDLAVKKACDAGVIVSARRKFLRLAPHFYQDAGQIERALGVLGGFLEP